MKKQIKRFIQKRLELRTRQFFAAQQDLRLVAVAGSVGKTSTKIAIATVLKQKYRVLVHRDNHNMELSVPLTIMKIPYPSNPHSLLQWWAVLKAAKMRPTQPFPYDVIVTELGTDKPGDMANFGTYLKPDIAVVTAVSPEHMQSFKNIGAVAKEELAIAQFSKLVVINRDDVDGKYAALLPSGNIDTYGLGGVAEYHFLSESTAADGYFEGELVSPEYGGQHVKLQAISEHSVKPIIAGALLGIKFGLRADEVKKAVEAIPPAPGRMQPLRGLEDSIIIDDTYNSSPLAATAALQTLYSLPNPHRIAILGSMNDLGEYSKQAHEEVGNACDPALLEWVVTIGEEAEQYLAPIAASRGCQVRSFKSPYDAGGFVHSVMHPESAILVKGSQDKIFAEEAVKVLLHSAEEETKLVRQSPGWMAHKKRVLSKF